MTKLIAPLLAIVLLGAGCSQTVTSDEAKTETKPAVTSTTEKKPEATKVETAGEVRELVAAKTDVTWKTYTSKSLDFSFQWPTRGRYAPQWESAIYSSDDAAIKDGCVIQGDGPALSPKETVKIGNQTFCHSVGTQCMIATCGKFDAYTTAIGKKFATIFFSKTSFKSIDGTIVSSGINCENESTTDSACVPFDDAEYQNTLDSIVGTFKLNP